MQQIGVQACSKGIRRPQAVPSEFVGSPSSISSPWMNDIRPHPKRGQSFSATACPQGLIFGWAASWRDAWYLSRSLLKEGSSILHHLKPKPQSRRFWVLPFWQKYQDWFLETANIVYGNRRSQPRSRLSGWSSSCVVKFLGASMHIVAFIVGIVQNSHVEQAWWSLNISSQAHSWGAFLP